MYVESRIAWFWGFYFVLIKNMLEAFRGLLHWSQLLFDQWPRCCLQLICNRWREFLWNSPYLVARYIQKRPLCITCWPDSSYVFGALALYTWRYLFMAYSSWGRHISACMCRRFLLSIRAANPNPVIYSSHTLTRTHVLSARYCLSKR